MERLTGGAKRRAVLDPLPTKGLPKSGPERIIRWIQRFVVVPKGYGARKPMVLAPFQKELIRDTFGDPAVRTALWSMPRGQGKTSLSAALALYALFDESVHDPEVLAVASDERTAGILLDTCRRMAQLNPDLNDRVIAYKDKLTTPLNSGVLRSLPATESALHGWSPSYLSLDELHMCTDETWTACLTAVGKRERSLMLAISTPALSRDTTMWRLTEHGRENTDPTFLYREYAAPAGCAVDDEAAWRVANPAIAAGFLSIDGLRASLRTTREPQFRRLRLGQWVDGADNSWVTYDTWMDLAQPGESVPEGVPVVLSFDGSVRNDSTILCATSIPQRDGDRPFVQIVGAWERDPVKRDWEVPRDAVDLAVRTAFERYDVRELVADPFYWQSELQRWHAEYGRVVEFRTNMPLRMATATDAAFAAIQSGRLAHDGDRLLALHVANVRAKETSSGAVPVKGRKEDHIDAAVAMILGVSRSLQLESHYRPTPRVEFW